MSMLMTAKILGIVLVYYLANLYNLGIVIYKIKVKNPLFKFLSILCHGFVIHVPVEHNVTSHQKQWKIIVGHCRASPLAKKYNRLFAA
jgi:hypothetical protein